MDLEQKSIERIRFASQISFNHYKKPIVCTYSGGKDSDFFFASEETNEGIVRHSV